MVISCQTIWQFHLLFSLQSEPLLNESSAHLEIKFSVHHILGVCFPALVPQDKASRQSQNVFTSMLAVLR